MQQLRGEATKLRESTVSAKQTVTDTLKGKLSAVQAKNKVKEELVATVDELRFVHFAVCEDLCFQAYRPFVLFF